MVLHMFNKATLRMKYGRGIEVGLILEILKIRPKASAKPIEHDKKIELGESVVLRLFLSDTHALEP
jgi:hypothetical protein